MQLPMFCQRGWLNGWISNQPVRGISLQSFQFPFLCGSRLFPVRMTLTLSCSWLGGGVEAQQGWIVLGVLFCFYDLMDILIWDLGCWFLATSIPCLKQFEECRWPTMAVFHGTSNRNGLAESQYEWYRYILSWSIILYYTYYNFR